MATVAASASPLEDLPGKPFTAEHFAAFAGLMVFEDGERREPEPWQLAFAADVFSGVREAWLIVPEGNGKSTLLAQLGLYGLQFAREPWIPVGAAARDQAEIIYGQAAGFIRRTAFFDAHFRAFDGYRKIVSLANGGRGLKVYAADPKTGDGVIPYPFALVDELHRHPDMRLYSTWKGKLRKRGAQVLVISTAGEPASEFENTREEIRRRAAERRRDGPFLRAVGDGLAMHEYMVEADEDCSDMARVKAANPLSAITLNDLAAEYASPTLSLADWKRFKCNRPSRGVESAITDAEWDEAETAEEIPAGAPISLGVDVGWKWDTTAIVPLWDGPAFRLLGTPAILVPPRDGSSLHPDEIKAALTDFAADFQVETVVMDMHRAEDVAAWVEDELGLVVIDHVHGRQSTHVMDFNAVMEGLRNGTLRHSGDAGLRAHVLNAVARRLPGGDFRFDRPSQVRGNARAQDRRVIDALSAAAMVVEVSTRRPPRRSVYEERYATS